MVGQNGCIYIYTSKHYTYFTHSTFFTLMTTGVYKQYSNERTYTMDGKWHFMSMPFTAELGKSG